MDNLKQKTNKQILPLWISEEHLSVFFYVASYLAWKSVFIKWHWGLVNPSVTSGFSSQTTKKAFSNVLSEFYQRKKLNNQTTRCAQTRDYYAMHILLCFSDVFSYFLKVLFAMFGKVTILLLVSSLWFQTAINLKSL